MVLIRPPLPRLPLLSGLICLSAMSIKVQPAFHWPAPTLLFSAINYPVTMNSGIKVIHY